MSKRASQPARPHSPAPARGPALPPADYFQIFQALPAPALLIAPSANELIEANDAWLAEFGYTRAEALGRTLLELGIFAYPGQSQAIIEALTAQGGRHQAVVEFRHRDGRVLPYLTSITSVSVAGQACWLAVAHDVSERQQAEAALRATQDNYRRIVETAREGIFIFDADWRLAFCNARFAQILGYAPEEILGQPISTFILETDRTAHVERRDRQTAGQAGAYENQYRTKAGTPNWLLISISPMVTEGRFTGSFGMATDITERKQAEAALRESEEKFKYIFDHSVIGKSITFPDGRLTVNRAFCEMLGYTPGELDNEVWQRLTHPDDLAESERQVARLLAGEAESTRFTKRYLHKSGAIVWADIGIALRRDPQGRPLYFITAVLDITERTLAEAALRASEAKLRALFAALPVGVSVLNPERRVIDSNPALTRLLRLTPEALSAGAYANRTFIHPDGRPMRPEEFPSVRAFEDQAPVLDVEIGVVTETGAVIWTSVSAAPVSEANLGAVVVTSDITERKQAEAALRESEDRLRITFQTSPDAFVIVGEADARLVEVNEQFVRLYGYTREEAIGRTSLELGLWAQPERRAVLLAQLAHTDRIVDFEVLGRRKNGETFPVLYSVSKLRWGSEPLLLGIVHDISERKLAEQQLLQLNRLYSILTRTNEVLVRARDRHELFSEICRIATADGWLRMAWVGLTDPVSRLIQPVAVAGFSDGYLDDLRITCDDVPDGRGPTGTAVREGRSVICRDIEQDPLMARWSASALSRGYRTSAAFPLRQGGQTVGALTVYAPQVGWFSDSEVALLDELAADISYALDALEHETQRQQAERKLWQAYDETIVGWSRALDLRDHETEGHSRRVTELTLRLAARLDVPPDELVHVRRGALLHDIGKMGVPDAILRKPGPLDEDELRQIRRHPQLAYELLAPIGYLQPALDIPYYHHEHWDGAGYPHRLQGEAIPLAARIFAVVDVWDALTSDRPYRPAWPRDEALAYIRDQAGRQFDPVVTQAFLAEVDPPPG